MRNPFQALLVGMYLCAVVDRMPHTVEGVRKYSPTNTPEPTRLTNQRQRRKAKRQTGRR